MFLDSEDRNDNNIEQKEERKRWNDETKLLESKTRIYAIRAENYLVVK